MNLAPKRPNWDLKRDLSRKLARVDRKTKRAIAELIRMQRQTR
jgi:coiled-coil domain-containing protein 12